MRLLAGRAAGSVANATGAPPTPIDDAIGHSMPGGDLTMAAAVAPIAVPGQKNAALAVATLLRDPLALGSQTVEIAVRALDADCGECRKLPSSKQVLTFSPRAGVQSPRAEVLSRLTLPPGSYEIRIAATLGSKTGNLLAHVDVPDFRKEKLAASGLVITATGAVATAERQIMADVLPVVPTAAREFSRGTSATAFLRLYQAGSKSPAPVRVTSTILDATDRKHVDQTTIIEAAAFGAGRSSDYRIDLPIGGLDAGAYLLSIEARAGNLTVKREARFWVR